MLRSTEEVLSEIDGNFAGLLSRWRLRPVEFCEDVLRVTPQVWQGKFFEAVARARAGLPNDGDEVRTRFSVRSGTGVGKTAGVAMLILWHLVCFEDSKIPCTAPTSPQLKAVLWPEIRKWVNSIPVEYGGIFPFDVQTDRVTLYDNFAVARTARDEAPESFQGFHSRNIMLVADEASGVADAIFLAGQGVMSEEGAITILIGNPTRSSGWFFDSHNSDKHKYWTMRVGCQDSERVSRAYIDDMREKHGENSYEFRVRVLGEFHLEDSGTIIPRPWVEEAVGRDVTPDSDWIVWGVDVSDGRDKSALSKRKGNILLAPPRSWGGKELMQSVGIVADEYWSAGRDERPDEICVDAIGMGTGFAQRLSEVLKGEPVRITRVVVSRTGAAIGERFASHRVELWARGRAWFEGGLCSIPAGCSKFISQISSVEWEVAESNGKWRIVDKKAGGESPDEADSFLLTFGGIKRDKSSFTKDKRGRTIPAMTAGIGSASYLTQGDSTHVNRYT